ncbi:hypothetical protein HHI36_019221 [Cryptolaemus montrouzieri]|uniref:Uncharacterized protein n=1 Tax=Cryptolaemus montrouzieri TaxID=559131 RepID=A0ABD2P2C4_9CUCU
MEIMPVKYEEFFNEEFGLDVSTTASASTSPQSDFFLSEDLWKKFESEYSELFRATYFDDFVKELTIDNPIDSLFAQVEDEERQQGFCNVFKAESSDNVMLHNHDCMWAGHCGSSEHPVEESRLTDKFDSKPLSPMIGAGAMQYAAPVACKGAMSQTPAQQSLLKPSLRSAGLPVINMTITPQTPPMSDDEDKHQIKQTQVLKIFPTPDDYDDTDQDLCEYFDGKLDGEEDAEESSSESSSSSSSSSSSESEDEEEPQPGPSTSYPSNVTSIRSNVYATENDHSYHKDKNASMRMSNLGIDTPSDSGKFELLETSRY